MPVVSVLVFFFLPRREEYLFGDLGGEVAEGRDEEVKWSGEGRGGIGR